MAFGNEVLDPPFGVVTSALELQNAMRAMRLFHAGSKPHMTTVLDKELKRQITVDGVDYTVAVHQEGIRLTGKGKRKPEVELRWRDLLSGEAAMAVALSASLSQQRPAAGQPATEPSREPAGKRAHKRSR